MWTLIFEMFFYTVAAILCLVPSEACRRVLVIAWGCVILVFSSDAIAPQVIRPTLFQIVFHPLNLIFIAGMIAWWLLPTVRRWPRLSFFLGAAALMYWGRDLIQGHPNIGGYALVPAFLVLACASIQLPQKSILVLGGNSSYGLYLLHYPLIGCFLPMEGWLDWTVCLLVTVSVGVGFGLLEYQLHFALNRWVKQLIGISSSFPLLVTSRCFPAAHDLLRPELLRPSALKTDGAVRKT